MRVGRCKACGHLYPAVRVDLEGQEAELLVQPVPFSALVPIANVVGLDGQPMQGRFAGAIDASLWRPAPALLPHQMVCAGAGELVAVELPPLLRCLLEPTTPMEGGTDGG